MLHRVIGTDVVQFVHSVARARIRRVSTPGRVGFRGTVQGADHAFHDVAYVGEVPFHLPIIEDIDGLTGEDGLREQEQGHVRPAPRSVDREEAQAGSGQLIEVTVGVGHELIGLLGGRVEAERMLHPVVPAPLQHVEETHQVAVYVGVRILQGIAHTGLSRHVGHALKALSLKETLHSLPVRQVQVGKAETVHLLQQGPARLLEAHVVVGVEVVQPHNLISALQQSPRQMETDEARRPGYKYPGHAPDSSALRRPPHNQPLYWSRTPDPYARGQSKEAALAESAHVVVLGSSGEVVRTFRGPLIRDLIAAGHRVTACAPRDSSAVDAQIAGLGAEYRHIPMSRKGLNPLHDGRLLVQLIHLLRELGPDVVISYAIKPVIYGSIAARRAGVPRVASIIAGLGYAFSGRDLRSRALAPAVRSLYRQAVKRNDTIFFQNPDNRDHFLHTRILDDPGKAVLINGSGVDTEHFAPTPLPPEPSFLLVSRLIEAKGVVEYAEACRRVKERYPQARCRLVGWIDEGPGALSAHTIRGWEEEGVLEFAGRLQDVPPALAEASVYVLPSYYPEGTPLSVLEALSTGRPVITTDTPGCRETVVRDGAHQTGSARGSNGVLVPPRDVPALTEAMLMLAGDPAQRERMGRESRRLAEEKFDVRKVNATILGKLGLSREDLPDDLRRRQ